jgi:subtilase family serine protease
VKMVKRAMIAPCLTVLLALLALLGPSHAGSVLREVMPLREGFLVHSKPAKNTSHEVIFALRQLNLDVLEHELLERATPGTSKYQQWMSFDEVGALISNPTAYDALFSYLSKNDVQVASHLQNI